MKLKKLHPLYKLNLFNSYFLNTVFFIITIPTANIASADTITIKTCTDITLCASIPVGGVNVTNSVALESLSFNATSNSPSFGFALPGIAT